MSGNRCRRLLLAALAATVAAGTTPAAAGATTVTLVGDLQSELGCSSDWQPDCAATHLPAGADDGVHRRTFDVPAGTWRYKGALDDDWTESYGLHGGSGEIPLVLGTGRPVRFFFDPATHWLTDDVSSRIVTAAGSFQSELGCSSDWSPGCLRSWLEDVDGDGTSTRTVSLPAGRYETKAALDEGWSENYGADGTPKGANIAFTVAHDDDPVRFSFVSATNVLSVSTGVLPAPAPNPTASPTAAPTTGPAVTQTAAPAGSSPPVVDRVAPVVSFRRVRQRLRAVRRHGLRLRVRASEPVRVTWRITRAGRRAGRGRFTVPAGRSTVRLRAARALARGRRARLTLVLRATDRSGNRAATARLRTTLRR